MKHNFKIVSALCILLLFVSGCASTTKFQYEYPNEQLSAYATSRIATVYPEDKRKLNRDIDKIWSDDPVEEIGKIIQAEIKSTGLFKEVLPVDKEEISESGARMVMYTSVMLLAWDVPFPPEPGDSTSIAVGLFGGGGGFGAVSLGTEFTDLYGKVKIKITLVDQDADQDLIEKEYYSSIRKTMLYLRTDLRGERKMVIWKALKEVMDQLKDDLKGLSEEGRI